MSHKQGGIDGHAITTMNGIRYTFRFVLQTETVLPSFVNFFFLFVLPKMFVCSYLLWKGSVIVSPDRTHDVFGLHSSCHLFNQTLRAHWFGFWDEESGLSGFRVAVGRHPNATDVLSFKDVGITANVTLPLHGTSGLFEGDIVYVTVEARNPAGLVTQSTSPPTRLISANNNEYLAQGDFFCYNV